MNIAWSLPVRGERLDSSRSDLVRARFLIDALRAQGHDVCVVEDAACSVAALRVRVYRHIVRRVAPRRIALVLRDIGRWLHARAHARRVAEAARQHRAEIIVETQVNFAGSGALAARETGLPLVLDDCTPASEETALGAALPWLAGRILDTQCAAARAIVVPSQVLRRRMLAEHAVAPEKLRVIPNGVNLTRYPCVSREAIRGQLGIGEECVFAFVGSFFPWHQTHLLVEAFAALGSRPAHLLLVGDGPQLQASLALARRLGVDCATTATGAVPPREVPTLLAAADVGVLPGSNDYGNPMKLLEYAAAGLPTVAPDLPPVREVVRDGLTGILFAPGNVDLLANAMQTLADDAGLRRRIGEHARASVSVADGWGERARALIAEPVEASLDVACVPRALRQACGSPGGPRPQAG